MRLATRAGGGGEGRIPALACVAEALTKIFDVNKKDEKEIVKEKTQMDQRKP